MDWQQEWWFHYGWNRPDDIPTPLDSAFTTVRKVEIHDVYDLKRWWWKATDGIRETTWPGVYNRSRLIGRYDYFQLPDWDCYSLSGKAVTFYMPDEPWNHLEISGGAWGNMSLLSQNMETRAAAEKTLFERPQGQEKTFHQFDCAGHWREAAVHERGAGEAHRRALRLLRASGQRASGNRCAEVQADREGGD